MQRFLIGALSFLFATLLFGLAMGLTGCKHQLVMDPNTNSIEAGAKRVETRICKSWRIGENGCVLPEGDLLKTSLFVYRVNKGNLSITGCGVEKSLVMSEQGPEWIEIKLSELLGRDVIKNDCVLDLYQRVEFPNQNQSQFPVQGAYGTVSLGACPKGSSCSMRFTDQNISLRLDDWTIFQSLDLGKWILRGCGEQIIPPTDYFESISVNLRNVWPTGYPVEGKNGCMFVAGVKPTAGGSFKLYHKVWLRTKSDVPVSEPSIVKGKFTGDQYASITIVDGKLVKGSSGTYHPSPEGNVLRFYTIQGRSLVVMVKDGKVEWSK